MSITSQFQSTLPVWGGTSGGNPGLPILHHFNPPSPCGEGPPEQSFARMHVGISIHPPRVGRDPRRNAPPPPGCFISIHPPRVGRDNSTLYHTGTPSTFQSTLPVWGGTEQEQAVNAEIEFQSTLPVWGGTWRRTCTATPN